MPVQYTASLATPATDPSLAPVNLADLTAKQLAGWLVTPPPHLLVDCGGLLMPHPLGVCRFVAQLLVIRGRGTGIWLCNLHPALLRCLCQLDLASLFHLNGPGKQTGAAATGLAPRPVALGHKTLW